jgi:hypothetical protein
VVALQVVEAVQGEAVLQEDNFNLNKISK